MARGVALLGAVLALAGGVELHPGGAGHAFGSAADRVFLCAAADPHSLHVEAAQALEREHCPACLHRLQTSGAEAADSVPLATLAAGTSAGATAVAFVPAGPSRSTRARGPPLP